MSTQPPPITAPNPAGGAAHGALANLDELTDVEDLARVLVVLEDFLIHADNYLVEELAACSMIRPDNPQDWVRWIAGLLGEHVITLRALIPTATALTAHQLIGEPR
jgi:hypothetical protein